MTKIPAGLSPALAAPLLCGQSQWKCHLFKKTLAYTFATAGIAMYSSIAKTRLSPGEWLAIPGAGGGLGHMYVQECLPLCLGD